MDRLKFTDKLTELCLAKYQNLPKNGKPLVGEEWTLLSAIVLESDNKLSVVAMATGTKCLVRNQMSEHGGLVNDSHAEVLARRCFLRYIYDQIHIFNQFGSSSIISCNTLNLYEIKPNIKFHFYTSHVPCGDSSIIQKNPKHLKRKGDCLIGGVELKRKRTDNKGPTSQIQENSVSNCGSCSDGEECVADVYRTGAKCVEGEDSRLPGTAYHTVGVVRTKAGRGDPTLCVSCSDKLARWISCGLQGSLLSLLLSKPVRLASVVVRGGGPYSLAVLERALLTRLGTNSQVQLMQSSLVFPSARYLLPDSSRPCSSAILWADVRYKPLEVSVEGRRQGTTKKSKDKGRLMVCNLEIFKMFMSLASESHLGKTYREIKASAVDYTNISLETKRKLQGWRVKPPHLEQFTLHTLS